MPPDGRGGVLEGASIEPMGVCSKLHCLSGFFQKEEEEEGVFDHGLKVVAAMRLAGRRA